MKRTVIINLKDITLPVSFEREQMTEIPEKIKEKFIEIFMEKFTFTEEAKEGIEIAKTSVLAPGVLFEDELYPGRVVRTIHNEIGIISNVRKRASIFEDEKPISVVLPGHRIWYYEAADLFKTDAQFHEARCIRLEFSREEGLWHEGDTGYIRTKGTTIPVIVGRIERGSVSVYEVSSGDKPTRSWQVAYLNLRNYIVEFLTQQERDSYLDPEELLNFYRKITDITTNKGLSRAEQLMMFSTTQFEMQPHLYSNANRELQRFMSKCRESFDELLERLQLPKETLYQLEM